MENNKKYTLTDLQEKKIAVKLRNYEEYKRLCDAVGDKFNDENFYSDEWEYYGIDDSESEIVYMNDKDLQGRILLDSIDEIDLGDEGKEEESKQEVKLYPFYYYAKGNYSCNCAVCKQDFQGDKRATMCLECAIKQHHIEIDFAYSQIARLKGENEKLIEEKRILISQLKESYGIDRQSPDLTKRERMAWEMFMILKGFPEEIALDMAFKSVDEFIKKSKEVLNG